MFLIRKRINLLRFLFIIFKFIPEIKNVPHDFENKERKKKVRPKLYNSRN